MNDRELMAAIYERRALIESYGKTDPLRRQLEQEIMPFLIEAFGRGLVSLRKA